MCVDIMLFAPSVSPWIHDGLITVGVSWPRAMRDTCYEYNAAWPPALRLGFQRATFTDLRGGDTVFLAWENPMHQPETHSGCVTEDRLMRRGKGELHLSARTYTTPQWRERRWTGAYYENDKLDRMELEDGSDQSDTINDEAVSTMEERRRSLRTRGPERRSMAGPPPVVMLRNVTHELIYTNARTDNSSLYLDAAGNEIDWAMLKQP